MFIRNRKKNHKKKRSAPLAIDNARSAKTLICFRTAKIFRTSDFLEPKRRLSILRDNGPQTLFCVLSGYRGGLIIVCKSELQIPPRQLPFSNKLQFDTNKHDLAKTKRKKWVHLDPRFLNSAHFGIVIATRHNSVEFRILDHYDL